MLPDSVSEAESFRNPVFKDDFLEYVICYEHIQQA